MPAPIRAAEPETETERAPLPADALSALEMTRAMRVVADLVLSAFTRHEVLPRIAGAMHELSLLWGLSDEQASRVACACGVERFAPGQLLFARGEPAERMFVLIEGEVDIERDGPGRRVGAVGPGEPVGEVALLTGDAHSASARARTPVTAATLDAAAPTSASSSTATSPSPSAASSARPTCARIRARRPTQARHRRTSDGFAIAAIGSLGGQGLAMTASSAGPCASGRRRPDPTRLRGRAGPTRRWGERSMCARLRRTRTSLPETRRGRRHRHGFAWNGRTGRGPPNSWNEDAKPHDLPTNSIWLADWTAPTPEERAAW